MSDYEDLQLSEEVNQALEKVLDTGQVVKFKDRRVLAGSYKWSAALFHLIEDHVKPDDANPWCSLDCFARFLSGMSTKRTREEARERIGPLSREMMMQGEVLLVDRSGKYNAASAMKMMVTSDSDADVKKYLDRMVRARDVSAARASAAQDILRAKKRLADDSDTISDEDPPQS